jgi:hypothetical protein
VPLQPQMALIRPRLTGSIRARFDKGRDAGCFDFGQEQHNPMPVLEALPIGGPAFLSRRGTPTISALTDRIALKKRGR